DGHLRRDASARAVPRDAPGLGVRPGRDLAVVEPEAVQGAAPGEWELRRPSLKLMFLSGRSSMIRAPARGWQGPTGREAQRGGGSEHGGAAGADDRAGGCPGAGPLAGPRMRLDGGDGSAGARAVARAEYRRNAGRPAADEPGGNRGGLQ